MKKGVGVLNIQSFPENPKPWEMELNTIQECPF